MVKTDRELIQETNINVATLLERTRGLPHLYTEVASQKISIKFLWGGLISIAPISIALRIVGVL